MSGRGLVGTPRPGAGYNMGGKRAQALAARLKEIKRRQAAGEDPLGKPLPPMPHADNKRTDR